MPYKPAKPCAHHGCPKLTHERYCEEHKRAEAKRYDAYERDKAVAKVYGGEAWKKLRKAYRMANPLCEVCKDNGRFMPAVLIHHKLPLREGGTNEWSNLQSLCSACHEKIHAGRGDRF